MARALLPVQGMDVFDTDRVAALEWDIEEADSTDEELDVEIEFTPEQEPSDGDTLEWDGASWVVVPE